MIYRLGLRLRVMVGFALIGGSVSLALGSWVYITVRDLDRRLIDEALTAEIDDYRARLERNPDSLPPMTATVRGYLVRGDRPDNRPPELRGLPSGRSEVSVDGIPYYAAVVRDGDMQLIMLHNRTQVERREGLLLLVLSSGILGTTLLAAGGGWWLAGRVIAPVRELATRVRERSPDDLHSPSPRAWHTTRSPSLRMPSSATWSGCAPLSSANGPFPPMPAMSCARRWP